MNESMTAEEQQLLDRLVDGELSEAERRGLLARLESQSDGWRRCALAFLEAQSWSKQLRTFASHSAKDPAVQPAAPVRRSWMAGPAGTLLAAAASFLVALGLGLAWRTGAEGWGTVAEAPPAQAPETGASQLAQNEPAKQTPVRPQSPAELQPGLSDPRWGTMTVSVDGDQDGVAERLELPVVAGSELDESWLESQPAALPPQVLKALERMGHRVEQQRQFFPFELRDGRRVVVPVDEIDVHYVGDRQYQ